MFISQRGAMNYFYFLKMAQNETFDPNLGCPNCSGVLCRSSANKAIGTDCLSMFD